jgi:ABC-2 type transport system permease protein
VADDVKVIGSWLVDGRAQIAMVVAEGYGADMAAGRGARVQLIADGTDSTSAVVGLGYASRILAGLGAEVVALRAAQARAEAALAGRAPRPAPGAGIELTPRVWYNPDLLSRWFYLPAILAMVLLLTAMVLPSMAVVREREIGTLEQLIVTPVRPWQLIVGKLLPFAVVGLINLLLVTGLIVWFFRAPLRGSFGLLILLTLPFLLTMLAAGLLVSTLAQNQQQAMMAAIFLLMVPMIYLSGLVFPIENMPPGIQLLTYAIPLRYYTHIIRGVFLKGAGFAVLWPDAVVLCGFAAVLLTLASLRFRKTLD